MLNFGRNLMWLGALERGGGGAGVDVVGFLEWSFGSGGVEKGVFLGQFLCTNFCVLFITHVAVWKLYSFVHQIDGGFKEKASVCVVNCEYAMGALHAHLRGDAILEKFLPVTLKD